MTKTRLQDNECKVIHEAADDAKEGCFTEVEIPDDKLKWVRRTIDEFGAVQKYLEWLLYEAPRSE